MNIAATIERFKKPGERERKELGSLFHLKRTLSYYLSIPFISLPLTPNQITVLSNLIQIAGVALIATLSGYSRLLGLFLYYLGDILDFVDGNIARYRSQCSTMGVFLDQLGHTIVAPLFFASIGVSALIESANFFYIYIVVLLSIGPVLIAYQLVAIDQFVPRRTTPFEEENNDKSSTPLRHCVRKCVSGLYHFKSELLLLAIVLNLVPALAILYALYFPLRVLLQYLLDRQRLSTSTTDSGIHE